MYDTFKQPMGKFCNIIKSNQLPSKLFGGVGTL